MLQNVIWSLVIGRNLAKFVNDLSDYNNPKGSAPSSYLHCDWLLDHGKRKCKG